MKRKILITGSNGLLGQKLVVKLAAHQDFELIATAKGENRIQEIKDFVYEPLDITNPDQVRQVFKKYQPQVIIHAAAMTNVDACEKEQKECWKVNVKAVEYLVREAEKYNTHFIHLSTDFVFNGNDGPYDETAIPDPLSYYGRCKHESEKIVENSELNKFAIVRTVLVYGVTENKSRSNVVLWAKNALEGGKDMNVVNDQYRTPTLAEDLAQGCILIAEKGAVGFFHISGKDFMNIYELVERVGRFYHLSLDKVHKVSSLKLNQPAKRPTKTGFILEKAKKELGYAPHSFEEGLELVDRQLKKK